jgi:hypothetical protein
MNSDRYIETGILIKTSPECEEEKEYIFRVLLGGFLGWDIQVEKTPGMDGIELVIPGIEGSLKIRSDFFGEADKGWLKRSSLPCEPVWCPDKSLISMVGEDRIPVIYGQAHEDGSWWKLEGVKGELALDIFGTSFFFLSRYEEAVSDVRDKHGRFPSSASVSSRWGVLNRPVVNEYLEIFWGCAKQIWPHLKRKQREFKVVPSHDIDWPYQFLDVPWKIAGRNFLRAIKRAKPREAAVWSWQYLRYCCGVVEADSYHTIRWILDQSDQRGLKSAFYYIPQQTHPELDPADYLGHPHVMAQWKMILERRHEIGVHPGYETSESSEAIAEAADRIRQALNKLGHADAVLGGRQHFLRWKTSETARHWEHAGLSYDSTLGYADHPGFRCGVCYEYPLYDVVARKPLNLRERPLIVMDCTVIDPHYMGLGTGEEALKVMTDLKDTCRKYHGDFTILWHNQRFELPEERDLYVSVLDA